MILQLNGVNAFYGASQILFGVNVEVEEADSVCVLGRNGVGKSTMMKSIVGNLNPKEKSLVTGSIRYCGDELVGLPAYRIARKGIAYVPQGRHIFPTLTTRENLLGVRVIRAFNRQKSETEKFDRENGNLVRMQVFVGKISALLNPVTYVIINIAVVAVIWVCAVPG